MRIVKNPILQIALPTIPLILICNSIFSTPGKVYLSSSAFILFELIRLLISLVGYLIEMKYVFNRSDLSIESYSELLFMSFLAVISFLQNFFFFYASIYLEPAELLVIYQGKYIVTDIISDTVIGTHVSNRKLRAFFLILVRRLHSLIMFYRLEFFLYI